MTFKDLDLHDTILKALEESGYEKPTPIQEQAIPKILEGCDLRSSAQTGTGKTAAFILPALQKMLKASPIACKGPRILILVPTRELALQVATQAEKYSKYMERVKTVCLFGGTPYPKQNKDLSRHYEILVATPGRLIDHLERGRIDFSRLEMLILDEADRMLDMGFIDPVKQIARATPTSRQTLLFSATLKGNVLNLSKELLKNPFEITITPSIEKQDIKQSVVIVDNAQHKHRILNHLLSNEEIDQAIIFSATKTYADQLVNKLQDQGFEADALHGNMSQRQRTKTITKLRNKAIKFLVATDVAARGIDVLTITHVFNFDLPMTVEDYVHRIGRTGRAGLTGSAITFVTHKEKGFLYKIEKFTGQKIENLTIAGLEASPHNGKVDTQEKNFKSKRRFKPQFKKSELGQKGRSQGYSQDRPAGRSRDYSQNRSQDRREGRSQSRSQDHPEGRSQSRSQDHPEGRSQDYSQNRSQERSEGRARFRPKSERPRTHHEFKPRSESNPEGRSQNKQAADRMSQENGSETRSRFPNKERFKFKSFKKKGSNQRFGLNKMASKKKATHNKGFKTKKPVAE